MDCCRVEAVESKYTINRRRVFFGRVKASFGLKYSDFNVGERSVKGSNVLGDRSCGPVKASFDLKYTSFSVGQRSVKGSNVLGDRSCGRVKASFDLKYTSFSVGQRSVKGSNRGREAYRYLAHGLNAACANISTD